MANKINDAVKMNVMELVKNYLESEGNDVLLVKSGTYSIPMVNEEGDELYVNITFSVPTGSRDGEGYDGYAEAQNYAFDLEEKARKAAEKARAKEEKKARDAERRAQAKQEKEKARKEKEREEA